jgi:hypothetical protein
MNAHIRASELREYAAFAIKDGFITCVGVLSAFAISSKSTSDILSIGIILVSVLAFSVSVRSVLSDRSERVNARRSIVNSSVILVSYLCSGALLLAPYILFSLNIATVLSVLVAIVSLFFVPHIKSQQETNRIELGLENMFTGVLTSMIGLLIGLLLK